jgi:hypothetical protein
VARIDGGWNAEGPYRAWSPPPSVNVRVRIERGARSRGIDECRFEREPHPFLWSLPGRHPHNSSTYGVLAGAETPVHDQELSNAQHLGQVLASREQVLKVAYKPFWGETIKRKRDKEQRQQKVGTWEEARDAFYNNDNFVYLRTMTNKDIPNWLNDPLTRPYGALPLELGNPETITVARGSNVVLMVGVEGLEPPTSSL